MYFSRISLEIQAYNIRSLRWQKKIQIEFSLFKNAGHHACGWFGKAFSTALNFTRFVFLSPLSLITSKSGENSICSKLADYYNSLLTAIVPHKFIKRKIKKDDRNCLITILNVKDYYELNKKGTQKIIQNYFIKIYSK